MAMGELARRELSRRHLLDFVKYVRGDYEVNWHHREIARKLEAVERGEIRRLMVFLPPRSGKSLLASQMFPAWYMGRNPKHDVITASYSSDLAVDFGRKVRNVVDTQEYRNVFRLSLAADNQAAATWSNSEGGEYVAAGVGGGITGKGAHLLIIDDPIKNRQEAESQTVRDNTLEWFRSTAYTRLAPNGRVVLIMTRWHDEDLAGALLREQDPNDPWEVLHYPAIAEHDEEFRKKGEALWPSRYPLDELEKTRTVIGTYEFSALYQGLPLDETAREFKREYFQYRDMRDVTPLATRNFLTVDTAYSKSDSADYTGIVRNRVDREGKWNVRGMRLRLSPLELIDLLFTLYAEEHYEKIGIEETAYMAALKPFLDAEMRKRGSYLPIVPLKHGGRAKELRIRALLPRYQSGSVYHVRGECSEIEEEALRFPKGAHDDVLDALAYQVQVAEVPLQRYDDTEKARPKLRAYANRFK